MKRILIVCAIIFGSLSVQSVQAQITSPDTMVHRIFQALKNKDEKAFVALYPNPEVMLKLLSKVLVSLTAEVAKMDTTKKGADRETISQNDFSATLLEEMKKKTTPEQMDKEYVRFAKKFRNILKMGEDKGVEWSNISLSNYTYDTTTVTDNMAVTLFGTNEMKSMKGVLHFTSSGTAYQVSFREIMNLPEEKGWYGAELYQLLKSGEEINDDIEMDSIRVETMDDAVEPPPPPTKPKPKTKSKTTPSKVKTKSKP